jgi:EmrB/QacA subfamily drug resistance transporter
VPVNADGKLDRGVMAIATVVILGAAMTILDTTIVNVAIDRLAIDFHTSLSTIQWVATGYMLALATVIPLTGWASERFGTKRLYMISVALFVAGSALSGAAWSAGSLIGFRILQGLGGGMVMPAGMTIMTRAAGPQRIGRVMAIVGVPMLLAPTLGPIIGGWLVDDISWRWIFYVNVPIGILTLLLALRILPRDEPQPTHRLDALGFFLLSPGLGLLVYALSETASSGGVGAAKVIVPLIAGAVLLAAFIWHALRITDALIDVRLFKNRTVSASALTTLLFGAAFFGAMLLLPLYYQAVRGESALSAGLLLAPQGLGAMVTMPIAGRLTDKTGAGRIVLVGLTLVTLGTIPLTQVTDGTSYWLLSGALFVRGLGMGATMMPSMSAAMQTLTHAAVPRATTALNIIMRVGGSIGTALLAVVLQHDITTRIPAVRGGGLGAAQNVPSAARAHIAPTLAGAFGSTFWWAVVLTAVAFLPALLLPRRKPEFAPEEGPPGESGARDEAPVPVEV